MYTLFSFLMRQWIVYLHSKILNFHQVLQDRIHWIEKHKQEKSLPELKPS